MNDQWRGISIFFTYAQDMIILILATDMARHAEILDAFKQKVDNFDFSSEDHLTSLKMILIKACDVSNECRPFMISEHWVECLLEEYFQQVAGHYVSNNSKCQLFPRNPSMIIFGRKRSSDGWNSRTKRGNWMPFFSIFAIRFVWLA